MGLCLHQSKDVYSFGLLVANGLRAVLCVEVRATPHPAGWQQESEPGSAQCSGVLNNVLRLAGTCCDFALRAVDKPFINEAETQAARGYSHATSGGHCLSFFEVQDVMIEMVSQ